MDVAQLASDLEQEKLFLIIADQRYRLELAPDGAEVAAIADTDPHHAPDARPRFSRAGIGVVAGLPPSL